MKILDTYFMKEPSIENAIEIFKGTWSSIVPGVETGGGAALFSDSRIDMICNKVGNLLEKNILELGPLEGGHSYMLHDRAKHVTAIEASSIAYLKCLIIKEHLGMNNVNFLLGDFNKYLETCVNYDFILACGVLYHCKNPIETIVKLSKKAAKIGFWSHYFMEDKVRPLYGDKFDYQGKIIDYEGYSGKVFQHNYSEALDRPDYCGGGQSYTNWMDFDSWVYLLNSLNFDFEVLSGSENHVHGPEFTAVAIRR